MSFFSEIAPVLRNVATAAQRYCLVRLVSVCFSQNVQTIYENDSKLLAEVRFLKSNLVSFKGSIENLESQTLPLIDTTTIVCETLAGFLIWIEGYCRKLNRLSKKMLDSQL